MNKFTQLVSLCIVLVLAVACNDSIVSPGVEGGTAVIGKKGGPPGNDLGPAAVTVDAGDSGLLDVIIDPDGAIRIGTDYDVGTDFDGSDRAASSSCAGVTFGIIEVGKKGSQLTEIIIWGTDEAGEQVTSGKQVLADSQAAAETDFALHVHLAGIPITRGKGKNAEQVCVVAVGDLAYDFI